MRSKFCWLLIIALAFSAGTERFRYLPLKKNRNYPLTLTARKNNPQLTDIYVDLPEQNTLRSLGVYADVYTAHPHPAEYHGDTLYLLKKKQTPQGQLTELWQYRKDQPVKLHSAYGYLTFRTAPDDSYLAVFADQKLLLLTTAGEKKRALQFSAFYPKKPDPKASYHLQPAAWNPSGTEFWFVLKDHSRVERVFYISALNWKYVVYDDLPFKPIEYAVSPLGRIAYSDADLNHRQNIFTLYIRDLRSKKTTLVATSNYRFEPEWRGEQLDFNSPRDGQARVTHGQ
ncbi:MAG: hypothetical protein LBQ83_00040 [Candidatus Margulisbacteria bacterium]|jgi:hypothetical protein|nr:hypothetical protein [Candidatus Margulisiibacteriota bacterium]